MCGRFTHMYTWPEVYDFLTLNLLQGEAGQEIFKRYNVAPTQQVPVARAASETTAEIVPMRWGLAPHWSKNPKKGPINARCETVETNGMFRTAFKKRRCIIPVSGFYEWQTIEGSTRKRPWYFYLATEPMFAFGGLWESWGEGEVRFASSWTASDAGSWSPMPADRLVDGRHNRKATDGPAHLDLNIHPGS